MEYISKEKVLELWRYWKHIEAYDQTAEMKGIEIVYCKDCKNFDPGEVEHEYERCRHHWSEVGEDDFCSYGEREGE